MSLFDDIQSDWKDQSGTLPPPGGTQSIRKRLDYLSRSSRGTAWILVATVAGLMGFFVYLGAFANGTVQLAMGLMLGGLIFRVALEVYGRRRLRHLDPTLPTSAYKDRLQAHYAHRKWVHLVATPIVLVAYWMGFGILLPDFKANLSPGFYTYILISGAVVALGLFWLILSQVLREFRLLRELRQGPRHDEQS